MRRAGTRARMWPALVLTVLGLGLAGLLAAGAVVAWLRMNPRGPVLPHVPLATDKTMGVNVDLGVLDADEREKALTAMEETGFRWLRQRVPWDAVEPERDAYDWTVWDEIVEAVGQHDLGLIAVLDGSPVWARAVEDAGEPLAPPAETRDFGDWVAAFAGRYADQIDYYQIWNEPNIAPHWGAREIDPAAYARLLREGAIQIRAVDPGAVILTAALAPNVEPGGANMSDLLFLDALYQQGAAEWFDAVAAQPYDFGQSPKIAPDPGQLNWNRVVLLREVMEAYGDEGTAVWAVSFGDQGMDPATATELVEKARESWPWLGPMLWAAWSPDDAHGQYALTGPDDQSTLVLGALQALAATPSIGWPGVYPADHPSGQYEGDWRVTPSGADMGGSGDRLAIPFRGTRLDLSVRRGDYRAFLFVTVDGQPANALPRDGEGRAYVVLYDPMGEVATVTLARGLFDGEHLAEIVAERGWGQWAIVGWSVWREGSGPHLWLPGALGLGAILILLLTIYLSWPHRTLLFEACRQVAAYYTSLDDRLVLIITAGAALLVYVMSGSVPTLAALGLLAVLLFLRPEMGLPLIALALPFYQLGRPLLGKIFSMVEILTLLTAAGWVVGRVAGHCLQVESSTTKATGDRNHKLQITNYVSRLTALDWGVIALVVVGGLSLLWAEHGRVAAREFRTVVLEAAIFYGLLRAMVRERQGAWCVADAWVLGGALIGLVGVFQWAFGQNLITAEGVWRVRGFYGSPNNLALYLGRVFPLAVAVAVFSSSFLGIGRMNRSAVPPMVRGTAEGRRRRIAYGLAALVMAAALFLTYSRGAWLLGVPVSLLFLAAMRGRRALFLVAAALIVVAVLGIVVVGTERVMLLLDTTEGTTFFRIQLWQSSWNMVGDHPVLGVGLDNFLYYYRTYYVLPTAWEEFNLSHPHNLVLDFWLRLGLPGLVVLLWLLGAFFRRAWRVYRRLPESQERLLVLGLMAGMVNFVAHGLVDNAFFLVDLAFVCIIQLALVQVWELKTEN